MESSEQTNASSSVETKLESENAIDGNPPSSTSDTNADYGSYLAIGVMLEDYTASYDNDISLPVGEKVYIWEMDNESWWKVQSQTSGISGFVPASFIEITEDYSNYGTTAEGVSVEYYDYDAANQSSEQPAQATENGTTETPLPTEQEATA